MIIAIIFVGLLLRLIALAQHDIWFDEALTYHFSKLPIRDLLSVVLTDNNPPLYYLLIHFIIKLSRNELILRLPSLIASMAIIPVIYYFLKDHFNQKIALIAAMLTATSPLAIYLATEARLHSLAVLFTVLVVWCYFDLIKNPSFFKKILFITLTSLGLYTQYYLALLLIPFTLIILIKKTRLTRQKWLTILVVATITFLPWLIMSAKTTHNACWCPPSLISLPATLVSPSLSGVGIVTLRYFPKLSLWISIFFATSAILVIYFFLRGLKANFFLSLIYLTPLTVLAIIGFFTPVFSPKAFAIYYPLYLTIVAVGVNSTRYKRLLVPTLFLILGVISVVQSQHPFFKGEQLKTIAKLVKSNNLPIAHTSSITFYSLKYYDFENQHILLVTNPLTPKTVELIGGQKQNIDQNIKKLWLVDTAKLTDAMERQRALGLITDYDISQAFQFDNISVSFLQKKNGSL